MPQRLGLAIATLVVIAAAPSVVRAEDLSQLLNLVTDTVLPNPNHSAHFELANVPENQALLDGLNQAIAGQFATAPVGSSSGGFTSTIDPATGVGTRNSKTFGPQFAERALTIGKHKWAVGVQYLHASYDNLNGTDITDGSLTLQLLHEDESGTGRQDPASFWQGDVMTNQLEYNLTLDTALVVGTFGVTDRFDLGLVLPFVNADLSIDDMKTVQTLATSTALPNAHKFPDGTYSGSSSVSESASGIGDVVLRGKYNFLDPKEGSGVALALDLRLPTGDESNFLGTGVTQTKLFVIGSWAIKWFSPHFNVGYTASFGSSSVVTDFPDEIDYVAGFEAECHPRVTFIADIIGRDVLNAYVPEETTASFDAYDPDLNGGSTYSTTLPQLVAQQKDQTLLQGALGLKINPGGKWLISVGALLPISSNGLTSNVAGIVGFDYSF
jgi:hypothetical protein